MDLDNIKTSFGTGNKYTAVKADFTLNKLTISRSMTNQVTIELEDLPDLVDHLLQIQNLDTRVKLESVESIQFQPVELNMDYYEKVNGKIV